MMVREREDACEGSDKHTVWKRSSWWMEVVDWECFVLRELLLTAVGNNLTG